MVVDHEKAVALRPRVVRICLALLDLVLVNSHHGICGAGIIVDQFLTLVHLPIGAFAQQNV